MIDLLVCAPSRDQLIQLGILTGFLPDEVAESGDVPVFVSPLNIHEIGEHSFNAGTDDEPEMVTVEGWWVMLAADEGTPIPDEILPLIVERDPENPAIPNRVWA